MKKKQTQYDIERQSHNDPVPIIIKTKVPNKWRFCDLETNQVYKWDETKNDFVLDYLPVVFPNFGDKKNIVQEARDFAIEVENFFELYEESLKERPNESLESVIQMGMKISKAQHDLWGKLIMWKLELDNWHKGLLVEKMMQEKANKYGKDVNYGGWHFCCGQIVNNGEICPKCGRG